MNDEQNRRLLNCVEHCETILDYLAKGDYKVVEIRLEILERGIARLFKEVTTQQKIETNVELPEKIEVRVFCPDEKVVLIDTVCKVNEILDYLKTKEKD